MNPGIQPGLVPPELGQDKEEPELATEDDIPSEEGGDAAPEESPTKERPADVERE
jgi:hypothetical protein